MTFDLTPTLAQHDLARRTHEFTEQVIRPVASDYDQRQETRPMVAAQALGIARAALEYVTEYALSLIHI